MATRRIRKRLSENTSKLNVNGDGFIKINLDGDERLLPSDEINKIVNIGDRFNDERNNSTYYRLIGSINPTVSNVLFNIDGGLLDVNNFNYSWSYFTQPIFTSDTVTQLSDVIKYNLKEIDGWFGYFDPYLDNAGLCNYFDMEPKRQRFSFVPDVYVTGGTTNVIKNWELTISYPYAADKTHAMVSNGLSLIDVISVSVGGRDLKAIGTPVLHNLNIGDSVRITGTTDDGIYEVIKTGLDNGDLKGYYFCIDVDSGFTVSQTSKMTRLVGGNPSEYYFRKFKKIKTRYTNPIETDDYEVYNLAFSESIFSDTIAQFVFNEDIDVSDLTDNLGRPLSEIYLTIIKTDSNGIFTNVKSGIEAPQLAEFNTSAVNTYLQQYPVIQKIHNGGTFPFQSFTPLENNVLVSNNDFYGDVVEYNAFEVKETILGDVYHRFNTNNRQGAGSVLVGGNRQEGYYYKAHHLIKIREFSNYIEQGDRTISNMPDYRQDLGDGRYLWRDLLSIGINQGDKAIDYPFLNGCHYAYQNYCFEVKRQDPFNFWNLYSTEYPFDLVGNSMTNNFKINEAEDVC